MISTVQDLLSLQRPLDTELLIVVFDLTDFTKFARSSPSAEVFAKMAEFDEMAADFVRENHGLVIKFIGDAGLCVFPAALSSQAICAMVEFKTRADAWLARNIAGSSRLAINCHFGRVTVGPTPGFNGHKQLDVMGEAVNHCFTMGDRGFILSPQAFRSLTPEARKHFHKYTPPIVYQLSNKTGET